MGNEHSINQRDGVVFQNNGKYITPNKLNHAQAGQQEAIVNNIFGINDPTLLTRSYWAKQQAKSSCSKNDIKQQSKSRLYTDSFIRVNHQFQPELAGHYEDNLDRRQQFTKSIVTDFRVDQGNESRHQLRNLSKNTSYSIIHRLKYDDENRSQSPFKNSQFSKPMDLRYSKFTKDKENFNYILGSGHKNNSQTKTNENSKKEMQRAVSQFKGTQKRSQQNSRRKVLDDVTLKSQISNIFGLENIHPEKCEQLTDRHQQELKSMRKSEAEQEKSRATKRAFKNAESQQRSWNNLKDQTSRVQHEFSEQTFSRFQEQNGYPTYLSKDSEKQASDRVTQKEGSRKSNMQRYKGLNEDSHNESLMKVMKRLTDLNLPINEKLDQNMNQYEQEQQDHSIRSKKSTQKSNNQLYSNIQGKSNFRFDLNEVKCSQKSVNSQVSIKSKNKSPQLYESSQGSKRSFEKSSQSNHKNLLLNDVNNDNLAPSSVSNHYCLENDIYHTESSQGLEDGYSQKFHFPINQSPKSLASQQRVMIRQRSCSGRLIETQKISQKGKLQVQNFAKNFNFSKKIHHQDQELSIYHRKFQPQQNSKFSKLSTKDYELMLKIQSLQQELKRLKEKQEQEKFQSRRYSPVKQQRMKISKQPDNEIGSEDEQEIESETSKYCINDVISTKPLKRRSQYFKLKIK